MFGLEAIIALIDTTGPLGVAPLAGLAGWIGCYSA